MIRLLILTAMMLSSLAAAPTPAVARDVPMKFEVEPLDAANGLYIIWASGLILPGATEQLHALVRRHDIRSAAVFFNSTGGSLQEGLALGHTIRELGWRTEVGTQQDRKGRKSSAVCASACAYAYLGGKDRYLTEYSGKLGFHQFYGDGLNAGDAQAMSGVVVEYLRQMGIDSRLFTLTSLVDPDGILWVDHETALMMGVSNNGVGPTIVELRLSSLQPYLEIEKHFDTFTVFAGMMCPEKRVVMALSIGGTEATVRKKTLGLQRAYISFDGEQMRADPGSTQVKGPLISFTVELPFAKARALSRSTKLGVWIENANPTPYGGVLDLDEANTKAAEFVRQCTASAGRD